MNIVSYCEEFNDKLYKFFRKVFSENNRKPDFNGKDSDILNIAVNYECNGGFWCALDKQSNIIGSIGLRKLSDCYEIRRFFVQKKSQGKGVGSALLDILIEYAISIKVSKLKAATMLDGKAAQYIFLKYGFTYTKQYNNSSADLFFEMDISSEFIYNYRLNKLREISKSSLILNPTENIPYNHIDTSFFEGLYVSERFKDVNDKVIFAGRNDFIRFCELIKSIWTEKLCAGDVDLKTLSGLNAHLVLFLCIVQHNESVLILPEICGGHFATQKILESFGANVYVMVSDNDKQCVDKTKTMNLIERIHPTYIFVDRSEGIVYEDFSWLGEVKSSYKIFDASQYLSQIITGDYPSPFDWGFDMVVSTLHKNYPGPQKGILAVKDKGSEIWQRYLANAKTYISNTHPMAIANSIIPLLNEEKFKEYSLECIRCANLLDSELQKNGIPVIVRNKNEIATLHIWILCDSKDASYRYYLKLERLNLLTNYRLLPYELGYGLRLGVSAGVRQGLRVEHIPGLAKLMAEAYFSDIDDNLIKKTQRFINKVVSGKGNTTCIS